MNRDKLRSAIFYFVKQLGEIDSRIKLVKLIYLADLEAKQKLGRTITGIEYVYHFYGPYSPEIIEEAVEMNGEYIVEAYNPLFDRYEYYPLVDFDIKLSDEELKILDEVIKKYGNANTTRIEEIAYETEPMKKAKPGEVLEL